MKQFLKKYILIAPIIIGLYSLILCFGLFYSNPFSRYLSYTLCITTLYFYAFRFVDDYQDFYKDKIHNKSVFERGTLLGMVTVISGLIALLSFFSGQYYFLFSLLFLLILLFFDISFLKPFVLPAMVFLILYYECGIHYLIFIPVLLCFGLGLGFGFIKKEQGMLESDVGGKAYHLFQIKKAKIPKFIVIPFYEFTSLDSQRISFYIKSFCRKNKKYAVRSSGIDEDSQEHSFAGIHESYLNVSYNDVQNYVHLVVESASSELALEYRRVNNLTTKEILIAVIIQEMVDADFAGVLNTINPVTNDMNELVISVCRGLGDKLVDGSIDGTTYYINGLEKSFVGEDILTSKQIKRILKLSDIVSIQTNHFQDVEFAIKKNKVYLLQTRDITTYSDIDSHKMNMLIDNANIIESYYGITTPLTFSFAKEIYKEVYTQTLYVGKVKKSVMEALKPSLENMLYFFEGKIYYNLKSWYHVTSIFPSKKSIKYMENMMGVSSSNSNYQRVSLNLIDIIKIGIIFLQKLKKMKRLSAHFMEAFNSIVMPYYGKQIDMSNKELVSLYESIEGKIIPEFTTPILNDCAVMFYFGRLKEKTSKYSNQAAILNQCVSNDGDVDSVGSVTEIMKLVEFIRQDPDLLFDFENVTEETLMKKYYNTNTEISARINDYIFRFGSRVMNELKLETVTMIEEPILIFGYLKNALNAKQNNRTTKSIAIPKKLKKLARKTKEFMQNREKLRLKRTYVFSVVRNIFLAFGKNYVSLGRIDEVNDIFYLTKEEIMSDIEDVRGIIENRRLEETSYAKKPYYNRIAFYDNHILPITKRIESGSLSGIPSGGGITRGQISLMESASDKLIPGNIILTKRTDPGWISLFSQTSGLIVEHGSMLSHSFVVAREMGLPAVVGVVDATKKIKDLDTVILDGIKGEVQIENEEVL